MCIGIAYKSHPGINIQRPGGGGGGGGRKVLSWFVETDKMLKQLLEKLIASTWFFVILFPVNVSQYCISPT